MTRAGVVLELRSSSRWFFVVAWLGVVVGTFAGDLVLVGTDTRVAHVLAERDGIVLRTLSGGERDQILGSLVSRGTGDGVGATIEGFEVLQVFYREGDCRGDCAGRPCNAVLLAWQETEVKTEQLHVYVNDVRIGVIDPLPPELVPGVHAVIFANLSAGDYAFRLESPSNGSSLEARVEVLDRQPFSDPINAACEVLKDPDDGCSLLVTWQNAAPPPTRYGIFLDGVFEGTVSGDTREFRFDDIGPGAHRVQISGVFEVDTGSRYRGCPLVVECVVDCEGGDCDAPVDLLLCQTTFAPGEHFVQAFWTNVEPVYLGGVHGLVNGVRVGTLAGRGESGFFGPLLESENRIGIQGDCGGGNVSPVVEAEIELRSVSPHPRPVLGEVLCGYDPERSESSAEWIPGDPSIGVAVHLRQADRFVFVGALFGFVNRISVSPTAPQDEIVLQFFRRVGEACYASERVECGVPVVSSDAYLPGACNGGESVDISSAVFTLNYLFLDGRQPPCLVACDCNGDLRLDLSDALCVLNFLFLDGPPPVGWVDGQPTCVARSALVSCDRGNALCAE